MCTRNKPEFLYVLLSVSIKQILSNYFRNNLNLINIKLTKLFICFNDCKE